MTATHGVAPGRAVVARAAALGSALLLFVTLVSLVPGESLWFAEQLNPFRLQYALAGLVLGLLVRLRPGRGWWSAAAVVGVNLACIVPLYLPAQPEPSQVPPLRVMSFNVHSPNREYRALRAEVVRVGPDVAFLFEVTEAWARELGLIEGYHAVLAQPEPGYFGVLVLSRVPVTKARVRLFSPAQLAAAEVRVPWHGRDLLLLGTHTLPPLDDDTTAVRRTHLQELAEWSRTTTTTHALFGDLNITPFSAAFTDLLEQGALRRAARGLHFTWPIGRRGAPLSIELDHALLGPDLTAVRYEVGEAAGSDHRPIIVDLTFTK